jgi:propanol-preferring alcohol dehydrogenase
VNCRNQEYTGVQHDGGYAEVLIAKATGLMSIPAELSAVAAAPLLCAGLTTFSALRNAPAKAGDLVAFLGIGGLGHLGVQYARHMGFEVVAIQRAADKEVSRGNFAPTIISTARLPIPVRRCRNWAAPRW